MTVDRATADRLVRLWLKSCAEGRCPSYDELRGALADFLPNEVVARNDFFSNYRRRRLLEAWLRERPASRWLQ